MDGFAGGEVATGAAYGCVAGGADVLLGGVAGCEPFEVVAGHCASSFPCGWLGGGYVLKVTRLTGWGGVVE